VGFSKFAKKGMISIHPEQVAERLIRYVQVDTQSDPTSQSHPTTSKQHDLARMLANELRALGVSDVEHDEFGYVYATIPATTIKDVPVICFCSHIDTAPDCSGTNVKPIYHRYYNGEDLVLPDDPTQVLRTKDMPYLQEKIGTGIITASGKTLLGSDDKGGVAAIMQAAQYLMEHPELPHGKIRILFTPDEEVGKGTAKIDMVKLGAQFGYTLDGGEAGSFEDETFSADGATITIEGVIVHPGYAKGLLVNALKIAGAVLHALPTTAWSPETTDKREGFVHPVSVQGIAERATIQFIVRDFDDDQLAAHHDRLKQIATNVVAQFPGASLQYEITEQYRNMKRVLDQYPQVAAYAEEAIRRSGLLVTKVPIRGGTDGSRLSYMGLPCPNVFTGMQQIHSKLEWISDADMAKAAETIVHLSMIWEEKT
jgi:tripeptide aminopeptidase